MLIEIKVPQLSESVSEATLLAWRKKVGEQVKRDENLIDIETDKVVLELPAPADGVLTKIVIGDGGTVKAGEVIATLDTEAKASAAASPARVSAPRKIPRTAAAAAGRTAATATTAWDIRAAGRKGHRRRARPRRVCVRRLTTPRSRDNGAGACLRWKPSRPRVRRASRPSFRSWAT